MARFVAFSLLAATLALGQTLMINSPSSLVQCQPTLLSWSGGTAPYYVTVIPGGEPSATPLESFAETSATSYTWTVDIASGTSITIALKDSTGALAYTAQSTIQAGTTTSCPASSTVANGSASTAASAAASSVASASTKAVSSASSIATSVKSSATSAASSAASVASSGASKASSAVSAAVSGASSAAASATKAAGASSVTGSLLAVGLAAVVAIVA
ncbi:hypothetical protein RQP46_005060 [Phenoliferia psychrophenolica]